MSKWTAGPWHVDALTLGGVVDEDGITVAQAQQVASRIVDPRHELRQANARLIAAAPELVEMLSALVNDIAEIDWLDGKPASIDQARALLEKVRDGKCE